MATRGPKRNKLERERDRRLIAELYLTGHNQFDIRDQLNAREDVAYTICQQQVGYDLKVIRGRWARSGIRDFDAARAQELAKIDRLESEYWEAWERVVPDDRTAPQYLSGVMSCIDRRCKLLGLDAPTKIAPTDPSGENPYMGLSDDDLRRALLEAATRAAPGGGEVSLDDPGEAGAAPAEG